MLACQRAGSMATRGGRRSPLAHSEEPTVMSNVKQLRALSSEPLIDTPTAAPVQPFVAGTELMSTTRLLASVTTHPVSNVSGSPGVGDARPQGVVQPGRVSTRPYRTATLTVLACNALVMAALLTWQWLRSPSSVPESPPTDGMVQAFAALILLVLAAAWAMGAGVGAVVAATIVKRKIRDAAGRSGQPTITRRTAILCGTVATPLGLMLAAGGLLLAWFVLALMPTLIS
jgi:hypothetical protein